MFILQNIVFSSILESREMRFQSLGLRKYKAHLLMTLAQMGYTILYFITEAAFNRGLNPYIYITYRHILAAVVVAPFAYFLERYTDVPIGF